MKCQKHVLTPAKMSQDYLYNESSYRALSTLQIKLGQEGRKRNLYEWIQQLGLRNSKITLLILLPLPLPSSHPLSKADPLLGPLSSTSNLLPDLSQAVPSSCHTISLLPFTPVHTLDGQHIIFTIFLNPCLIPHLAKLLPRLLTNRPQFISPSFLSILILLISQHH